MKLDKLFQNLLFTGAVVLFVTYPASSQEVSKGVQGGYSKQTLRQPESNSIKLSRSPIPSSAYAARKAEPTKKILQLSEIEQISRSADALVQLPTPGTAPASIVQITGVKANPTEKGVEIILETTVGKQLQVTNRSTGNNFIADIPNAQLRLPSGEAFTFRSEKPLAGITQITVTNFDANTIRVTVTGEAGLPQAELFDSDLGLIFGFVPAGTAAQNPTQQNPPTPNQPGSETPQQKPSVQQDQPIELVVTGEQDGYRVPNATGATRTDTPIRDIPQSIQVVPQQVLQDQQVTRLEDALRNVTGVAASTPTYGENSAFTIRGFSVDALSTGFSGNFLRNGTTDLIGGRILEFSNIERVEVLKGPGSVLFGRGTPGGTINIITKQPLRDPFYAVEATIGSYDFYRGALDFSGPLNDSKTVLYRLNASYKDSGSFVDFFQNRNIQIAPVISWAISENTKLTIEAEYVDRDFDASSYGLPAAGTVLPNPNGKIPRNRNVREPDSFVSIDGGRVGYALEHKFSDNWSVQNVFRVGFYRFDEKNQIYSGALLEDNRTLTRQYSEKGDIDFNAYYLTTDVVGKFSTGSINHKLLFGFDLSRLDNFEYSFAFGPAANLDLFNPVYRQPRSPVDFRGSFPSSTDALGIYVQDQITLTENLKVLLGLRFDTFEQTNRNLISNTETFQTANAFSPRAGIVYQPIPPISLYASYAQSFSPASGTTFDGSQLEPERGRQYEVGIKADLNNRLSATLSFFDLTRSNVPTADLVNTIGSFVVQTGEQKSRGIEFDISGEILPGWNVIAGYAYTDATITEDETIPVGNRLDNAPEHSFNLWTTYELQQGYLKGLGFGLGLFFVGERQGDLANTFALPSYLRTDAAIFYKRDRFRAGLNFRNIFDVNYFESAFNFSNLNVFPGDPFTVQGTVSWQF